MDTAVAPVLDTVTALDPILDTVRSGHDGRERLEFIVQFAPHSWHHLNLVILKNLNTRWPFIMDNTPTSIPKKFISDLLLFIIWAPRSSAPSAPRTKRLRQVVEASELSRTSRSYLHRRTITFFYIKLSYHSDTCMRNSVYQFNTHVQGPLSCNWVTRHLNNEHGKEMEIIFSILLNMGWRLPLY